MDELQTVSPRLRVEDTHSPAVITYSAEGCIGAETAKLDSGFQVSILSSHDAGSPNGAEEFSVRRVEQELVAMCRRLPQQQPSSVRGPCQAMSVGCVWIPGSQDLPGPRVVDADDVSTTRPRQDGKVRGMRADRVTPRGRGGQVELGVCDLDRLGSRQIENDKLESKGSTCEDLVFVGSKLNQGLLSTARRRVPNRGMK